MCRYCKTLEARGGLPRPQGLHRGLLAEEPKQHLHRLAPGAGEAWVPLQQQRGVAVGHGDEAVLGIRFRQAEAEEAEKFRSRAALMPPLPIDA